LSSCAVFAQSLEHRREGGDVGVVGAVDVFGDGEGAVGERAGSGDIVQVLQH
jgi:hypothetical protein